MNSLSSSSPRFESWSAVPGWTTRTLPWASSCRSGSSPSPMWIVSVPSRTTKTSSWIGSMCRRPTAPGGSGRGSRESVSAPRRARRRGADRPRAAAASRGRPRGRSCSRPRWQVSPTLCSPRREADNPSMAARAVVGREDELATLLELVTATAAWPRALLLEGEAGAGKTTLWQSAVDRADGLVLATRPLETETKLAYAGVGDLLEGVHDKLGALPEPQAKALRAALLLEPPDAGVVDERAVALGFLGLLVSEAPGPAGSRRPAVARPAVGARARLRSAPNRRGTGRVPARASRRGALSALVRTRARVAELHEPPGSRPRHRLDLPPDP